MFGSSWLDIVAALAFLLLLLLAGVSDLRSRRISNRLVACMLILGFGFAVARMGGRAGTISAASGLALGLALWLPCYALRLVAAGDVKFFAAASAWLGPQLALSAALLSALFGGALAIGWVVWRCLRVWRRASLSDLAKAKEHAVTVAGSGAGASTSLPYGVAMSAGLGIAAWFPHLLR